MRRVVAVVVVSVLLCGSSALCGLIYGTIKIGKRPIGPGVQVAVTVKDNPKPCTAITDKSGAYRVYVTRVHKECTFKVTHEGQAATHPVRSLKRPVQYNWILELPKGGKPSLRRE